MSSSEPVDHQSATLIAKKALSLLQQLLGKIMYWWKTERHQIFAPKNSAVRLAPDLKRWQALIEIAAIVIIVWTYCWGFLDLGHHTILPGNEAEMYPTLDWIFTNALHQSGHFLTWDPNFFSGLPLIGDPMFHFFNPLVSVPILILGVADGFKTGVFLSFIAGALGMWFLALAFGMKPVARIWVALLFAFAGQPTARFFQGEYLFVFAWAFIPWVIGGLYAVYRTRRRVYAAITAFALGEMFLSGNAYYVFFMIFIIVVFLLVFLFTFSRKKPVLRLNLNSTVLFILISLVAVGLIAVQVLPTIQLWPRISKAADMAGSANLGQVLMDFLSSNSFRPDMYPLYPAREEFYAFIGYTPFLFLLLLPLALIKRNKRTLLFVLSMLVVTLFWIDVKDMPWAGWYRSVSFLYQFRHQIRMIIYTEVGLLILLGYALDTAWQALWNRIAQKPDSTGSWVKRIAAVVGGGLLLGLAGYSIVDVYTTNRPITFTVPIYDPPYQAISWLDHYDQSIFYTRYNPNNASYNANITNHMRLLEPLYYFADIRVSNDGQSHRRVQAHPNYVIQGSSETPPANSEIINTISGYTIYHSLDALPFSFAVNNSTLADSSAAELKLQDVSPLTTFSPNGDLMEIVANGNPASTLVTLVTNFPGWVARIDGKPAKLRSINGYLAVSMLSGVHQYTFSYESGALTTGTIISLISLLVLFYWVVVDLNWAAAWAMLKRLTRPGKVSLKERIRNNPLTAFYARVKGWQTLDLNFLGLNIQIKRDKASAAKWAVSLATILFVASLVVYAITHFVGLKQYPIYFFADEATQSLYAKGLIDNHFKDASGNYLPIYYEADPNRWTPVLSIYPQVIGLLVFGESVLTTRGTSAAMTFLAVIALALILKRVFKARYWWIAVLILGLIPAWFLHSRTAFETAMMSSFFAVFILFYLLYLTESPKYIIPAVLFAGFTFYTYSNGQIIAGATCLMFLVSDFRYHLKHLRTNLWALLLGLVMMIPLIQYTTHHLSGQVRNLEAIGSYWFTSAPLTEKLWMFIQKYAYGLSPQYWFFTNAQDLTRHKMDGFGHIWLAMLPFFLIGLVVFLWHFRSPKHRAVILAMLAVPISASLADIGITRVLAFVIPAALLISVGLDWLLGLLSRRSLSNWIALITFAVLAICSINLLQTALTKGPFWDTDYGLYGMQWGATQLFEGVIPKYLAMDPNYQVRVSSTWANASDRFITFFLSKKDQSRVTMDDLDAYTFTKHDLNWNTIFISTPAEYKTAQESNKFDKLKVSEIIPYPDGSPGFYILQASYRSDVDAIFAAEKAGRKQLVEENYTLNGQNLIVRHSAIDMGSISNLFDNNRNTLIRGQEANPFILEIEFPQPQSIQGISLQTSSMKMHVTATLYAADGQILQKFEQDFQFADSGNDSADIIFGGGPYLVKRLHVEILNKDIPVDSSANIHVREFRWH